MAIKTEGVFSVGLAEDNRILIQYIEYNVEKIANCTVYTLNNSAAEYLRSQLQLALETVRQVRKTKTEK